MIKHYALRTLLLLLAVMLVAALGLVPEYATAQDAATTGQTELPSAKWVKRCLKRTSGAVFCEISYGRLLTARNGTEQWIASAGIQEVVGKAEKEMFIFAPLGVRLLPGLAFRVDEDPPQRARFTICMIRGCQVVVKVDDTAIASLKKGNDLLLQFQHANGKTVSGKVPLTGFTAAYDGEPVETRTEQAPAAAQAPSDAGAGGKGDAPVN